MMKKKTMKTWSFALPFTTKRRQQWGIEGPGPLQQENGDHHDGGKWSSLPFVKKR